MERASQRTADPATRPAAHNTDWRWNLGGPSTAGSSDGAYQSQVASQAGAGTGLGRATEWRWNLGGPSQQPAAVATPRTSSAQAHPGSAAIGDRPVAAGNRSENSSASQRPWQRRRMLPDISADQASWQAPTSSAAHIDRLHRSASNSTRESDPAGGRTHQQGWRRMLPRFLGQMLPGAQLHQAESNSVGDNGSRVPVAAEPRGVQTQTDDVDANADSLLSNHGMSVAGVPSNSETGMSAGARAGDL